MIPRRESGKAEWRMRGEGITITLPGIPRSGTEHLQMRAGIALIELLIGIVVAAMTVAALFGYLTR